MSRRAYVLAALLALALLALAAPSAGASFSVDTFSAAPVDPRAAAHSDFTVAFDLPGDEQLKDLDLELPPGLVGNPNAAARCSAADFASDSCQPASQVGSTTIEATATIILIPTPITASGDIFNLEPQPGEPARLGIVVRPLGPLGKIFLQSPVSVRTTSDFGLTSILRDMPTSSLGLPIKVDSISLTLNAAASGGSFMTNPTSCDPAATRVRATSYDGSAATRSTSFTPTDCAGVPFTPSLTVTPQTTAADTPSAYDAVLGVPAGDTGGRAQSHVRCAAVVLPEGTGLNAPLGQGLEGCSDNQLARGSDSAPTCPVASDVGDATIVTPLLGTLSGNVYLGTPAPDDPYRVFVAIPLPGGWIKLPGSVSPNPSTGQLTSTFSGLPPVPFTSFTLSFRGGDRAVLVNDVSCGPQVSNASLAPYSGAADASPSSSFTTTGCSDPQAFGPTLGVSSSDLTAGASPAVTMDIARQPGEQLLRDLEISLPAGLVGGVSGVGLCLGDAATSGNCPAESRVGSATTVAGAGGDPLRLGGSIFLTTGTGGAPAALLSVIPARVGPYDFGNVIVRSNIRVRAGDAGFEVSAPDLPQVVGGIPLRLRGLALSLDRPGFLRNPTSCDPKAIEARFTSTRGAQSVARAGYQATGCAALPFSPRLSATAGGTGNTARLGHPGVTTTVTQGPGEAAARSVEVTLPQALGPSVGGLTLCPAAQAAAHTCPAASKVGEAQAFTPLLPAPLSGGVFITENQGGLPRLTVDLQGLLSLQLTGDTALTPARLSTKFDGIPDVPLSRFVLRFAGGPGSLLQAGQDLCTARDLKVNGAFGAHSGATSKASTDLVVEGCPPKLAASIRGLRTGGPVTVLKVTRAGSKLRTVAFTLPRGLKFGGKAAMRKGASVVAGTRRLSVRVLKVSKPRRTVTVSLPSGGVDALRLSLRRGAVVSNSKLRRAARRRPSLSFAARVTDADRAKWALKKKVRGR